MSKVLYVEPDDEITDLVEKIRRSGEENELVFVLPHRTKVLQSPLNLRLLQQYSRSFVKRTAIVTGDPRVQELARGAGFPTFASVQAFERGIEVVRPHPATPEDGVGEEAGDAMPPVGQRPAAAALVTEPAWAPTPERAPVPGRSAGPPGRRPVMPLPPRRGRDRRRALYYGAAAVFLVGLLLIFLVAPSATVTLTIAATPVSSNNPIQGTNDANLAAAPDHVLTTVETADESSQFQAKPSGQKTLPATAAGGNVVLQTDLHNVADFTVPKGTEFDTSTTPQIKFQATQDTVVHFGDPDSTGIATSNPVPVQDATAEAAGNVGANTITQWPNNPCGPNGQYHGVCAPSDLTVTNPQPTSGGADAKQVVVASASDVQGWQKQVDDLKGSLGGKIKQDMGGKAGGDHLAAVDPGGSGQTLACDVNPALPRPDDQFSTQTVTVACHGKGAYYNPADVKKVVAADLAAQVPHDQTLADRPTISDPKITQASDDGSVIFAVSGSGFSQPIIDVQGLKSLFAGQSSSSVRSLAREKIGQLQDVSISQSIPFFVLPFFSGRIEVKLNFVSEAAPR
jgi:hypothetical protein